MGDYCGNKRKCCGIAHWTLCVVGRRWLTYPQWVATWICAGSVNNVWITCLVSGLWVSVCGRADVCHFFRCGCFIVGDGDYFCLGHPPPQAMHSERDWVATCEETKASCILYALKTSPHHTLCQGTQTVERESYCKETERKPSAACLCSYHIYAFMTLNNVHSNIATYPSFENWDHFDRRIKWTDIRVWPFWKTLDILSFSS